MALMVNGKKVLGYAIGGNEFYSLDKNADGSINIGGQNYFSTNKMNITETDSFFLEINEYVLSGTLAGTIDVTRKLSDYGGYLAILKMKETEYYGDITSRPFSIPTTTTTDSISFYDSYFSGSLSMNTANSLILTVSYNRPHTLDFNVRGKFYILSNDAS